MMKVRLNVHGENMHMKSLLRQIFRFRISFSSVMNFQKRELCVIIEEFVDGKHTTYICQVVFQLTGSFHRHYVNVYDEEF